MHLACQRQRDELCECAGHSQLPQSFQQSTPTRTDRGRQREATTLEGALRIEPPTACGTPQVTWRFRHASQHRTAVAWPLKTTVKATADTDVDPSCQDGQKYPDIASRVRTLSPEQRQHVRPNTSTSSRCNNTFSDLHVTARLGRNSNQLCHLGDWTQGLQSLRHFLPLGHTPLHEKLRAQRSSPIQAQD